jgi:hypothetical protein
VIPLSRQRIASLIVMVVGCTPELAAMAADEICREAAKAVRA